MNITIEVPVIIVIGERYSYSRLEALKKEFKEAKSVSEHDEGFIIQFNDYKTYYKNIYVDFEKRVQKALKAGDKNDRQYELNREKLAKEFVPVERIKPPYPTYPRIKERVIAMDNVIDEYLALHKEFLKKKDYSLAATYGSDTNELIILRNAIAKGQRTKAIEIAYNMDEVNSDAIPNSVYDYVKGE